MKKNWRIKAQGDPETVKQLSQQLNINPVLANLLVQRGINTFEEAKNFFRPSLDQLHDPFLMKDMDKAIERLNRAIADKETVLIYGDYDVDGTTAVSLVYTFIASFYDKVDYYIPDRYKEGYGISFDGIDFAAENNVKLIIALDCGIKAIDKVAYAKAKGVDFIICDHHRPGNEIPKAVAVLDPKRSDCHYPYDELSGCGVGFKLIQAYAQQHGIDFNLLIPYLDLVVVSIAADIVPITGENRILAHFGLKQLNTNPRQGIKTLLELSNVKRELSVSDLVFVIGPRINAAGRIDNGKKAVALLVSKDAELAKESGIGINKNNTDRRDLDAITTQQALEMIERSENFMHRKTTVLFHPNWHKGVVGIVASRLTEKYYRPTIILTESNGLITGSARSVKDFDLYEAINACSDLLEQFGGHKYAAGLTLKPENLEAFCEKFEATVAASIEEYMLTPEIDIDARINFEQLSFKFQNIIRQLAPFGPGNPTPVFMTEDATDKGYAKLVGLNHLKMDIYQAGTPSVILPAIAFQQGDKYNLISKNALFNICYSLETNEWNGNVTLQLNIKDILPKTEM